MTEWIEPTRSDGRKVHVRAAAIDVVEPISDARTQVTGARQILAVTESVDEIRALLGIRG